MFLSYHNCENKKILIQISTHIAKKVKIYWYVYTNPYVGIWAAVRGFAIYIFYYIIIKLKISKSEFNFQPNL